MKKILASCLLAASAFSFSMPASFAASVSTEKIEAPVSGKTAGTTTTAAEESGFLNTADDALRNMSRAERRQKMREVRKTFREWRRSHPRGENTTSLVLLIILAILIPPLAVGLYERRLSSKFWISLLLTILFYLPGMIYSLLVVTGVA